MRTQWFLELHTSVQRGTFHIASDCVSSFHQGGFALWVPESEWWKATGYPHDARGAVWTRGLVDPRRSILIVITDDFTAES